MMTVLELYCHHRSSTVTPPPPTTNQKQINLLYQRFLTYTYFLTVLLPPSHQLALVRLPPAYLPIPSLLSITIPSAHLFFSPLFQPDPPLALSLFFQHL